VNNWGGAGRWAFHVCRDPQQLARELRHLFRSTNKLPTSSNANYCSPRASAA
jgi:hypothetical protein